MRAVFLKLLCFVLVSFQLEAQAQCNRTLSGYILDKSTKSPLAYANVYLEETQSGATADSLGFFSVENICPQNICFKFYHLGCKPQRKCFSFAKDTLVYIYLTHYDELLNEVVVHGEADHQPTQISTTIDIEGITKSANKNLSDILEQVAGVSTLKTGSGISKPIVHGLFGNRVAIINNGISQSGQQWGDDHAPEIDPFVADHLSVVKGASSLAYNSSSLGSVVLVEPSHIGQDSTIKGDINYIFQSNGLGSTLNARIEKSGKWASWRATGTAKLRGDTETPDYFLTNTGQRELDFAFLTEKKWNQKWDSRLYYSLFNTEIGILKETHSGESAIGLSQPPSSKDYFSYDINPPSQKVSHHLLKLEATDYINDNHEITFKYGGQLNDRKEFDIRRAGRSDKPSLSILQFSHYLDATHTGIFSESSSLKSGVQLNLIDNTNQSEDTGILPFIPDYLSYQTSVFSIYQKEVGNFIYEIGGRYDFKYQNVVTINGNVFPRTLTRYTNLFHNYAFLGGLKYTPRTNLTTNLNIGHMQRFPEVNELYSSGLHQAVGRIELGNESLKQERSTKILLSLDWSIEDSKLFLQAVGYFQNIDDFIYLQYQGEETTTIRGTFPIYAYEQANAHIYGADFLLVYEPINHLKWTNRYALVRGDNTSQGIPLVDIPADNIQSTIHLNIKESKSLKNNYISVEGKYVFEQYRYVEGQDLLPPPPDYFLLGMQAGTRIEWNESALNLSIQVENMLNKSYRDYLNRLRYFADEIGINISIKANYQF